MITVTARTELEVVSGDGEVITVHSWSTPGQLVGMNSMELNEAFSLCNLGASQSLKGS